MRKFGTSKAGGRRAVPRTEAPLLAILSTVAQNHSATLMDISRTGARLTGISLPAEGEELTFRTGKVEVLGGVVSTESDQCAVEFDIPIAGAEVNRLRSLANFVTAVGNSC